MKKDDLEYQTIKYNRRKTKTPYFLERNLINQNDYKLQEFEIFDGKDVRWGIRESNGLDAISFNNTTPLFENNVDKYGRDKERILYFDSCKVVFKYRVNNSDVLGTIDKNLVTKKFMETKFADKEEVSINKHNDNVAYISFKINGILKSLYYDLQKSCACSNIYDAIYNNNRFLKSYQVGNSIRAFIGIMDSSIYTVHLIGYDINKREFIDFPLTRDGLIDEKKMKEYLQNEKHDIGYNLEFYKNIDKNNLVSVLINLGMSLDGKEWFDVLMKLYEDNNLRQKIK